MARLIVNPDSPEAWTIELQPGANSLGRGEENDFQLEHSSISSIHCQITVSGSTATLKDLGSTSGTFIEGKLVEEARLRSGQIFSMGDVQLRFEDQQPDAGAQIESMPAPGLLRPRPLVRVQPAVQRQRPAVGDAGLPGALLYPLKKGGILLLAGGTLFFSILEAAKYFARFAATKGFGLGALVGLTFLFLFTAVGVGYLTNYLRAVITGTAMGAKTVIDWPEISDFKDDILSPLFQLAVTLLVSLVPAILVAMFIRGTEKWATVGIVAAGGLGAIYFPMAFLAVAMFDSVAAVNPLLVVPAITKVPAPYLFVVVLFGAVLAVKWAGDYFLPKAIPVPIVWSVLSIFVGLYLVTAEARALGLLFKINQRSLGWFNKGQ